MIKLWKFIKALFSKSFRFVTKYIEPSILIVEKLKFYMDSPLLPLLTSIIPGSVDDVVAATIKRVLPDILKRLKLAEEIGNLTDPNEIIQAAIKALQGYDKDTLKAYYLTIASMLADALADGKLEWSEIVHLVQFTYTDKIKK